MMKNEIIYNKWNEFICNKKYFKTKMYELKNILIQLLKKTLIMN